MLDLPNVEWVVVDTETSGKHPDDGARVASVGLAWVENGQIVTRGYPFDQGVRDKIPNDQTSLFPEEDPNLSEAEWLGLLRWLAGRGTVYQNGKFDIPMIAAGTRHWDGLDLLPTLMWDTALYQSVVDPTELKGLDATAARLALEGEGKQGADEIKAWLRKHKYPVHRYDLAPWSVVGPYVTHDAKLTAQLYLQQRERAWDDDPVLEAKYRREMELCRTLIKIERRGVGYDAALSRRIADRLEAAADELERKMPFGCSINEAKRWFFDRERLEPARRTDKGAPSLDEEQVRAWVGQGIPWAKEYADVSKARRSVSMHYGGYVEKIGPDGRLRCVYKQGHVRSGRMSVERIQLQALPKKDKIPGVGGDIPGVRELLRAGNGRQLWSLDLSQAELRVASQYCQCKRMLELLAEGLDVHGNTCEEVMGVRPDAPDWKEKRDIAKRLNFSAIFAVGPETFQATLSKLADLHLPIWECRSIIEGWRQNYPEFMVAYRKAEQVAARKGYVRLLPNTEYEIRSQFGPHDYAHTAWNRIVQGSLAEAFKLLMVEVEKRWPYLILTVHDSLVLELPTGEAEGIVGEIREFGAEFMTDLFKIEMSLDADVWDLGAGRRKTGDGQYDGANAQAA